MSLPNTGLSFSQICRYTGTYTNDLYQLCLSPNININSRWKPIRDINTTGSTDSIMKLNNFGLGLNASTTAVSTDNVAVLLNAAIENNGYTYLRPVPGIHPARLGDWRNYNREAIPFLEDNGISASTAVSTTYSVEAIVNDPTDVNVEITPEDFSDLTQNKSEWYYRALYKKVGTTTYQLGAAGDPLWINNNLNDQSATAPIDFSLETRGDFDCCLILTRNTTTGGTYPSYLVPGSYVRVKFNPSSTPFSIAYNYTTDPVMTFLPSNQDYKTSVSIPFDIIVNQGETITDFNFNIFIKDNSTDILTASYTASTLTDASPTIVLSGSYFYCGSEPELDIYSIYGTISYRYQSNTYTRYFDFGSEVVSASQVDTSMATLYQSYGVPHS